MEVFGELLGARLKDKTTNVSYDKDIAVENELFTSESNYSTEETIVGGMDYTGKRAAVTTQDGYTYNKFVMPLAEERDITNAADRTESLYTLKKGDKLTTPSNHPIYIRYPNMTCPVTVSSSSASYLPWEEIGYFPKVFKTADSYIEFTLPNGQPAPPEEIGLSDYRRVVAEDHANYIEFETARSRYTPNLIATIDIDWKYLISKSVSKLNKLKGLKKDEKALVEVSVDVSLPYVSDTGARYPAVLTHEDYPAVKVGGLEGNVSQVLIELTGTGDGNVSCGPSFYLRRKQSNVDQYGNLSVAAPAEFVAVPMSELVSGSNWIQKYTWRYYPILGPGFFHYYRAITIGYEVPEYDPTHDDTYPGYYTRSEFVKVQSGEILYFLNNTHAQNKDNTIFNYTTHTYQDYPEYSARLFKVDMQIKSVPCMLHNILSTGGNTNV